MCILCTSAQAFNYKWYDAEAEEIYQDYLKDRDEELLEADEEGYIAKGNAEETYEKRMESLDLICREKDPYRDKDYDKYEEDTLEFAKMKRSYREMDEAIEAHSKGELAPYELDWMRDNQLPIEDDREYLAQLYDDVFYGHDEDSTYEIDYVQAQRNQGYIVDYSADDLRIIEQRKADKRAREARWDLNHPYLQSALDGLVYAKDWVNDHEEEITKWLYGSAVGGFIGYGLHLWRNYE